MKRIGLISDTHGYLEESVFKYFATCDEIWHAGDIGSLELTDKLKDFKPLKAVYGNIDDHKARVEFPKNYIENVEGCQILMTHIAGSMGKYNPEVRGLINLHKPSILICGHSHILKIAFDKQFNLLYINPGAAGNHGFHKVKTLLRFAIHEGKPKDMEVIELGRRR